MSLIVLDTSTPEFQGNRIFDADYASRFPGALATAKLHKVASSNGYEMITSDVYARLKIRPPNALCISDRVTPFVSRQLQNGRLVGAILANFESPNVDIAFYHSLRSRSALFKHAFLFRGVRANVAKSTVFHEAYFPQSRDKVVSGREWADRDLLVMIASNRQAKQSQGISMEPTSRIKRLKRCLKAIQYRWYRLHEPMLRVKDLYKVRLDAAYYYSRRLDFRLYGIGWDRKIYGVPSKYDIALTRCKAGAVDDKILIMQKYRFALCFENCVFPGYVTEKIFDCFFSGCIPIYYGAPDISEFVPQESFIDFRMFSDLRELERFITELPDSEAIEYLKAAKRFLHSAAYRRFHEDTYVSAVMNILDTMDPGKG